MRLGDQGPRPEFDLEDEGAAGRADTRSLVATLALAVATIVGLVLPGGTPAGAQLPPPLNTLTIPGGSTVPPILTVPSTLPGGSTVPTIVTVPTTLIPTTTSTSTTTSTTTTTRPPTTTTSTTLPTTTTTTPGTGAFCAPPDPPLPPNATRAVVVPRCVRAGDPVLVTGGGFAANTPLSVYLFSQPSLIGTVTSDAAGNFRVVITIPAGTAPGVHTIHVVGIDPAGRGREAIGSILVFAAQGVGSGPSGVPPGPSPFPGINPFFDDRLVRNPAPRSVVTPDVVTRPPAAVVPAPVQQPQQQQQQQQGGATPVANPAAPVGASSPAPLPAGGRGVSGLARTGVQMVPYGLALLALAAGIRAALIGRREAQRVEAEGPPAD